MAEFKMPSLGADMSAGTLIAWLKNVGDKVHRGDIIAEVDTDKGVIEVEVFTDGTIENLVVKPGEKVPVGTPLAIIAEEGKAAAGPEEPSLKTGEKGRVHVSPVARKLAAELGVDLTSLNGSGPGGRIQREDVLNAAALKQPNIPEQSTASSETEDRVERIRRAISAAMTRSKREIPHYYLAETVDINTALNWLDDLNAGRPIRNHILYGALLIKAVALALRKFPDLNATWENDKLCVKPNINIGVAISLRQGGLVSPAIHDTDKLTLEELMAKLSDLTLRTRSLTLRSSELSDATVTVSNLGERSVEAVFGVIYPPQVALLGFGKVFEGVAVSDGSIRATRLVKMTLSADHRASDGHQGSAFLATIAKLLQEPEKL